MANHYRIEMAFNWNRVLDRERSNSHFLDHYCISEQPADGTSPCISTFRVFEVEDTIEFILFKLGDKNQPASPQSLEIRFQAAEDGLPVGSPICQLEGDNWHNLGPLRKVECKSLSFGDTTVESWKTRNLHFVINTEGRFMLSARLTVKADTETKIFSFDPEMIVGEGTAGGPGNPPWGRPLD